MARAFFKITRKEEPKTSTLDLPVATQEEPAYPTRLPQFLNPLLDAEKKGD
jgi:hypothetical protein